LAENVKLTKPTAYLAVTLCFFLSGLAGLVYEVVWARQLSLFLGTTAYAHTAVITAYMAGLAAGSLYFGCYSDRHPQPLRIYAWQEVGVGLYAAATPWLFDGLQKLYIGAADPNYIGATSGHLTRFGIALAALLVPTFLMGGTLPLLVRGFTTALSDLGRATGRLYGINTLGAVSGTLLTGYLLLPRFGVQASIYTGVAINLIVAIAVLAILPSLEKQPQQSTAATEHSTPSTEPAFDPVHRLLLLIGFSLAGFASLLTQMAWIRALILVVGGSVYAFTITLACFLAGIGVGSLVFMRFLARPSAWLPGIWSRDRMAQAAALAALISLTLLLGLAVIGKLPGWFLAGYSSGLGETFPVFQLFILVLCAVVILPPTLLMGALFPLVTVIWTRGAERAGQGVGAAYAINTTGTILGAMLGGLFILPWLGVHYSVHLAAGLYFLVAAAFWLCAGNGLTPLYRFATIAATAMVLGAHVWLAPAWDPSLMVSGVFRIAPKITSLREFTERSELLYYEEGLDAVVAVRRIGDNDTLVINGKPDASSKFDLPTQILLGQLPLSLDRNVDNALVIGLGSGITAGTLTTSDRLESLTILEISKEVVEASTFFEQENYHVLNDPRVNLVTADARNFLMADATRYDLIISEPSNPWISGISNLFTDEFFKLAKSRLSTNGVMTQWFHSYRMSNDDLRTLFKTFDENFQHVSAWQMGAGDLALIGSDQPYALSVVPATPVNREARKRAGELQRADINTTHDLAGSFIFGGDELTAYASDAPLNSDDNAVIEFSAPKNLYKSTKELNLQNVFESLGGRKQAVPLGEMVRHSGDDLDARFMRLRISGNEETAAGMVQPKWEVTRRKVEENRQRVWGTRNERLLTWREGSASFHLKAVKQSTAPSRDSLEELLEQTARTTGGQGGMIQLPGNIDAVWLLAASGLRGGIQLDIAWDCQAQPSGSTRFALRANLPNIDPDTGPEALARLASRLHCY
jgi:spermidine synthase